MDDQVLPVAVAWDALARLDAGALVAVCDPEIRFRSRITAVEGPAYEGHQGVRRYIANLADAFERIERNSSISSRNAILPALVVGVF